MNISIITITKNNHAGLRNTLASIKAQVCSNFELIIIDGRSTDGTDLVLTEYRNVISCVQYDERDGIYAAMDQGIARARGKWLIFLNAGDCFFDKYTLANFNHATNSDIVCGISRRKNGSINSQYHENFSFWAGMPTSHQSIFFRRSIFKQRTFNNCFKISADFEYLMWAKKNDFNFEFVNFSVATVESGGISETKLVERVWETYIAAVRYFPKIEVHLFYFVKIILAFKKQFFGVLNIKLINWKHLRK